MSEGVFVIARQISDSSRIRSRNASKMRDPALRIQELRQDAIILRARGTVVVWESRLSFLGTASNRPYIGHRESWEGERGNRIGWGRERRTEQLIDSKNGGAGLRWLLSTCGSRKNSLCIILTCKGHR